MHAYMAGAMMDVVHLEKRCFVLTYACMHARSCYVAEGWIDVLGVVFLNLEMREDGCMYSCRLTLLAGGSK
jgi:hypothetical protein